MGENNAVFKENKSNRKNILEQRLIVHLQKFLLESDKGFSFVARQKRIALDGNHYYVTLVFYNYILKCFVVIDLKTGTLTDNDVGRIDSYIRYFNDKMKPSEDNPTIGILLRVDKNDITVRCSAIVNNDNLFASKYELYLPTEDELKRELKCEREITECRQLLDGENENGR